ncbi:Heat shock protein 75 kDa, mitochondrial [Labeo rohita]|uniref:Heat shock protein 75 kDa, mitochondrial n=1 Tax=Labeo rohita TaxID=84645 RepID=A0ABQ8LC67_LABRO|nr:Heat shock protein 75 kDa, mitochondrial [Labeo rohita]
MRWRNCGTYTAPMEIHLQTDDAKGTFTIQRRSSSSIIGQFGVGFYSAVMVADKVDLYSQSAEPGTPGYKWSSDR